MEEDKTVQPVIRRESYINIIVIAAVIILIIAIIIIFINLSGRKTINLNDYLTITVTGIDGSGRARYSIDKDALYEDYSEEFDFSDKVKKEARKITEKDIAEFIINGYPDDINRLKDAILSGQYSLSDFRKIVPMILAVSECDASDVAEEMNGLSMSNDAAVRTLQHIKNIYTSDFTADAFLEMFIPDGQLNVRKELFNGQTIKFTWDLDNKLNDTMRQIFNYSMKCRDVRYTVKGLRENPAASVAEDEEEKTQSADEAGAAGIETDESEVNIEAKTESNTQGVNGKKTAVDAPPVSNAAIKSVTATSALAEYGMVHSPDLMIDGDFSTGWSEGVDGYGIGESVTITLDGVYTISIVKIYAGYQKSRDLFQKNGKPREILLSFSDGSKVICELGDFYGGQRVHLPEPVQTDSVTITIRSAYPGSTYEDTVITEIKLLADDAS